MYYDEKIVSDGAAGLEGLKEDADLGRAKADPALRVVSSSDGGLIFNNLLKHHDDNKQKLMDLISASERLLGNAGTNLRDTTDLFSKNEQENMDQVAELWNALEIEEGMEPVGPAPDGSVQANDGWWQASLWAQYPGSTFDQWIFKVMSWPDYLSLSWWARQLIDLVAKPLLGQSLWDWIWGWVGGEWEPVEEASFVWEQMGQFFVDMSEELDTRMQIMFTGWYDSDAATAAGGYFAKAAAALETVEQPMQDLQQQYYKIAVGTYGLCQTLWSLVDAIVDTAIAAKLAGVTFVQALAAPFTGGVTAGSGIATLILAAVEAVSAAWGYMMTAFHLFMGIGATLGANLQEIEWVTLPEG